MGEFLRCGSTLGEDATLKPRHVEEEVGVVLAVDRDEALLPLEGGDRTRQTVLHVPEDCSATGKMKKSRKYEG